MYVCSMCKATTLHQLCITTRVRLMNRLYPPSGRAPAMTVATNQEEYIPSHSLSSLRRQLYKSTSTHIYINVNTRTIKLRVTSLQLVWVVAKKSCQPVANFSIYVITHWNNTNYDFCSMACEKVALRTMPFIRISIHMYVCVGIFIDAFFLHSTRICMYVHASIQMCGEPLRETSLSIHSWAAHFATELVLRSLVAFACSWRQLKTIDDRGDATVVGLIHSWWALILFTGVLLAKTALLWCCNARMKQFICTRMYVCIYMYVFALIVVCWLLFMTPIAGVYYAKLFAIIER